MPSTLRRTLFGLLCAPLLVLLIGCSPSAREKTDRKTAEAKQKMQLEAHRLGEEAHNLRQNIGHALTSTGPAQAGSTPEAEEKLRRGGEDLRAAGSQAAVKLDRAAMVAKVKTKLATDVGLSTVTSIDVDTTGHVVTLRGTVSSEDQRRQAEQAALEVSGVTKVVNDLRVQP